MRGRKNRNPTGMHSSGREKFNLSNYNMIRLRYNFGNHHL